ncbi:hypothetical protein M8J77_022332 [Diaphorina citri]|nr:hypothetical protein M8J77_022332 [Diaphorina citri]
MANKHSSIILTHTLLTILLLQLIRTVDSSSWNPSYSNRAENALARFNSRFSKAIAEELDNSTVAMDNNTVEENMVPSSTTSDDVTYYPSRKEKPSGKVEEFYVIAGHNDLPSGFRNGSQDRSQPYRALGVDSSDGPLVVTSFLLSLSHRKESNVIGPFVPSTMPSVKNFTNMESSMSGKGCHSRHYRIGFMRPAHMESYMSENAVTVALGDELMRLES